MMTSFLFVIVAFALMFIGLSLCQEDLRKWLKVSWRKKYFCSKCRAELTESAVAEYMESRHYTEQR
jgi:hypothetical protein